MVGLVTKTNDIQCNNDIPIFNVSMDSRYDEFSECYLVNIGRQFMKNVPNDVVCRYSFFLL